MKSSPVCWAVMPAAGCGSRMQVDCPKQYLPLAGQTVIEYSLQALLGNPEIQGCTVALAEDDSLFSSLPVNDLSVERVIGGETRAESVYSALKSLSHLQSHDWVLVHDAARPCLRADALSRLILSLKDHPVGGLLGFPVADTLKQVSFHDGLVEKTIDRTALWNAQTPQMFRYGVLLSAMEDCFSQKWVMTDEASAIEYHGSHPLMVMGHGDNIKITRPEDLLLAEFILKTRQC
jgi:2-C-methyl-D-erythritol 4-phosphate cytidylyltransferase